MAGAGFKTFNTGDVLTSSDVNTYLMQQTVMVFDDASARSTALPTPSEGMFSYLKDTNLTYRYDGSAWLSDAGATSPLTTKGDLWTYSTTDARLPVGTNGYTLIADSAETTGLKWAAPASASGPAFKATGTTNQALSQNTWTKAQLGTETFDTDSCYDNSVNYRFTPNKAGYYSFQTAARITHGDATAYYQYAIYKNGALENLMALVTDATNGQTNSAANLIYFNGTTDYAEFYVYTGAANSQNLDRASSYFSGVWIRS